LPLGSSSGCLDGNTDVAVDAFVCWKVNVGTNETRGIWWVSFILFAGIGVLWAITTPLLAAPDEDAHAIKAASVAFHGAWPVGTSLTVPAAYGETVGKKDCLRFHPALPANCAPPISVEVAISYPAYTQVGPYPPLYYALVGWPARVLSPRRALYAMRFLSALLSAVLLASAVASLSLAGPRRWLVPGFALAMTPMALYLTGVINPNGMEIAAAACVWTTLLALLRRDNPISTRFMVRLGLSGALFAAARPLSPVLLLTTVALVVVAAGERDRLAQLARDTKLRATGAVLGVVIVVSAAYVSAAHSFDAFIPNSWPKPPSAGDLARAGIDKMPEHTRQLIGIMGYNDNPLPSWLIASWVVLTLALVVAALVVGRWRERLALGAVTAFAALSPVVMALMSGRRYGLIWQGRYTLPLAIGVPLLASWVLGRRVPRHSRMVAGLGVAIVVFAGAGQFVAHLQSMTRYVLGLPHGLFQYLSGGPWRPPLLSPGLLFVVALIISVAYSAFFIVLLAPPTRSRASERPESTDDGAERMAVQARR